MNPKLFSVISYPSFVENINSAEIKFKKLLRKRRSKYRKVFASNLYNDALYWVIEIQFHTLR